MGIYKLDRIWYVRYRSPETGKVVRKSTGVSDKRLALDIDADIRAKIATRKFLGIVELKDMLFDKLYVRFLDYREKRRAPRTVARNKDSGDNLLRKFSGKHVSKITLSDIEDFVDMRLDDDVVNRTINIDVMTLGQILNHGIKIGCLHKNPVDLWKQLPVDPRTMQILTMEQGKRLMEELPSYTRPIAKLAVLTGMRKGEVLNLKWSNILLDQQFIKLMGSRVHRERFIPINNPILILLESLGPKTTDKYLFAKSNDKPYGDIKIGFKNACMRIGIPDFRFHDLRSTFAVRFLRSSGDLRALQLILGHKSLSITAKYLPLAGTHLQSEMAKMEQSTKRAQAVPVKSKEPAKC